jgi:hypothetical protein
LALALLSDGDGATSGAAGCSAPRRPEILEVWEPFKAEDSGDNYGKSPFLMGKSTISIFYGHFQ